MNFVTAITRDNDGNFTAAARLVSADREDETNDHRYGCLVVRDGIDFHKTQTNPRSKLVSACSNLLSLDKSFIIICNFQDVYLILI